MTMSAADNMDQADELAGRCVKAIREALCRIDADQVIHPDLGIQERVLCYELYHQMRMMEELGELKIHPARVQGELNKRAQHRFLGMEAIPDLLIHEPGPDWLNLVVLEAKTARTVLSGAKDDQDAVRRDLGKLALFGLDQHLGYRRRVFLISGLEDDAIRCAGRVREFGTQGGSEILVLIHDVGNRRIVAEDRLLQDPQWYLNYLLGKKSITPEQAEEFGCKAEIIRTE